MDALQVIAPLIGVVLGAAVSGIGALFRARAERKRLIARALADLLEIRHHVVAIEVVLREVRTRAPVSDEEALLFRTQMKSIVPLDTEIHKRYNEAVSLLAGVEPVLAFDMRSKNRVSELLELVTKTSTSLGATPSQTSEIESLVRGAMTPALDKAVLKLASLHSFKTRRHVRKIVAKTADMDSDFSALLNRVTAMSLSAPSANCSASSN